jgi:transposase
MGANKRIAGVDWASAEHAVLVEDADGEVLAESTFAHDEDGIQALCRTLRELKVQRVAIERPDGLLVERLLDAGLVVYPLHPNQVKAARSRFRGQGKSDRFDAFVLAELARTDSHRFRALDPDSDQTKALRALTRTHEDLVGTRVALANQLGAALGRFWPGAAQLFAQLDSPISLAFLARYPSPAQAKGLGPKRMASFLARNGYSGRQDPQVLIDRLRAAPQSRAGELEAEALRETVTGLVATLHVLVGRITQLKRDIRHALDAHLDGQVFRSLFRDPKAVITAARLLAEIGDSRARYPTPEALAADGGMSAVAIESGKRKVAGFRWACDKRLRDALGTLADASRHHNPWAHRLYADACARGHDHNRALRTVGRAWTRVIWRMWQDGTPYDPARHRALQTQLAIAGPDGQPHGRLPTTLPAPTTDRIRPRDPGRQAPQHVEG